MEGPSPDGGNSTDSGIEGYEAAKLLALVTEVCDSVSRSAVLIKCLVGH